MYRIGLMKIAFFHNLPTGGHKRAAYEQAKRLSQRGHEVHEYTLSTTDNKIWDISQVAAKSYVYNVEAKRALPPLEQKIAQDINGRAHDVCLVQPCLIEQTPSILEFLKTPSIYYCPEPQRILFEPYLREKLLEIRELKKPPYLPKSVWEFRLWQKGQKEASRARAADLILTNSYYSREVLYRTYGVLAQVNYLGVDTEIFRPTTEVKKENAVLHVGTNFIKQPEFSIEVVAQVPEKIRPKLYFRSQPEEKLIRHLKKIAQEKKVAVEFLAEVDDLVLVNHYNQVKLTICPSLMEPFGLVAIESMACGTLVLAVKEGGYKESVVDGKTGFLLDRDPQLFAKVVVNLLEDPQSYQEVSRNAPEHIKKNWGWEKSITELERFIAIPVKTSRES